ncbi:Protein CBG13399 [Caenorhabditis briggsae]|uniref:Protein CBG13399 n=1 Tax=Caenorhabditis briggsae TaxID=6238 RepID=A8XHU9_CAEBR|nr:Protein CBG13399 [Caenorhabditis briggsae]CAP32215.2 Protein CBG13399 [Caenorhabditis briggsae]
MQNLRTGLALCQICEREFTEDDDLIPRILSECGHTLCTECIRKIAGTNKNTIHCPFDRISTSIPGGDVKKLKKNFTILQMKEEERFRKRQMSSTKRDKKARSNDGTCDENPAHRAANFCKICDADLCDECWDLVHSLTILAHHEKSSLFAKPIEAPPCTVHLVEKAAFVCTVAACKTMGVRPSPSRAENFLVIQTYSADGSAFTDKLLELKRFRYFAPEKDEIIESKMKDAVEQRIDRLLQRIANQRADLDWIRKNKASLDRLMASNNVKLVSQRWEVDMTVGRIESAVIKHPKALAVCANCIVHVPSLSPFKIEMRPAYRLEIRDNTNALTAFFDQKSTLVSAKTNIRRFKNHFFRLIEQHEVSSICSEGLSLIIVVDPFNGDHDKHCDALELLENATAYESIVVGLTPFNFQAISTFLAKLVDIGERDPRVRIVYINDQERDVEQMVEFAMSR